jgi:DNA topoisomerase-1
MPRKGGWTRAGSRRRFRYYHANGGRITDPDKIERIESLRIPPAWRDVWISPRPNAKLQATGIDAAGRRQYLYHADFRAQQEEEKFDKLVRFADKLSELRAVMAKHMELEELDPDRICALAVRLINHGWFRVGSEQYARKYKTFGITTLRKKHVKIRGSRISFAYPGKRRIWIRTALVDGELAAALRELKDLPGRGRLFRYRLEDGNLYNLTSRRLNEYVQTWMGDEFSAKDFRTWGGTLIAAIAFAEHGPPETASNAKRTVATVMRTVGEKLGNTPTIARASYVSPAVVEQYLEGRTLEHFRARHLRIVGARDTDLDDEERALLSLLRSWRIRKRQAERAAAA